jgi:hypothetical protein
MLPTKFQFNWERVSEEKIKMRKVNKAHIAFGKVS